MNLGKIPIFAALTRKMDWLSERQRVISQNIANADTPGYRARDLKPMSFREMLSPEGPQGPMRPTATSPMHMAGGPSGTSDVTFREQANRKSYEMAPSGNGVALEEQLVKLAETQLEYNTATNLYRKQVGLIRAALGRSRG